MLGRQRFHQECGHNFFETYSPVIKPATTCTILCLVVSKNWPLRQQDVKYIFLHGYLQDDVYMKQPPEFVNSSKSSHVCKLVKSLYDLKQRP